MRGAEGGVLGVGLALAAGVGAYYFLRKSPAVATAPGAPAGPEDALRSALRNGLGLVHGDSPTQGPSPIVLPPQGSLGGKSPVIATPSPPKNVTSATEAFQNAGLSFVAPVTPTLVGGTVQAAGQAVKTGVLSPVGGVATGPTASVQQPGGQVVGYDTTSPFGRARAWIGDLLGTTGTELGAATPVAGVFAVKAAITRGGIRGKSKKEQEAIFGQSALGSAQFALGYVPIVGAGLGAGLGVLAGTHEGKRAVRATGHAAEQGYTGQKEIFRGHVSQGLKAFEGGSSHRERVTKYLSALAAKGSHVFTAQEKTQDAQARKLAADIAAGKGAPGDVSSSQPNAAIEAAKAQGNYGFVPHNAAQDAEFYKARAAVEAQTANVPVGERNTALMALNNKFVARYGA